MSTSSDDAQPANRTKEQKSTPPIINLLYLFIVVPLLLIRKNDFKSFFVCSISKRVICLHDLIEREVMSDESPGFESPGLNNLQQHGRRYSIDKTSCKGNIS